MSKKNNKEEQKTNNDLKKIVSNKTMLLGAATFVLLIVVSYLLYGNGKGTFGANDIGKCWHCADADDPYYFYLPGELGYDNIPSGCNINDVPSYVTEKECKRGYTSECPAGQTTIDGYTGCFDLSEGSAFQFTFNAGYPNISNPQSLTCYKWENKQVFVCQDAHGEWNPIITFPSIGSATGYTFKGWVPDTEYGYGIFDAGGTFDLRHSRYTGNSADRFESATAVWVNNTTGDCYDASTSGIRQYWDETNHRCEYYSDTVINPNTGKWSDGTSEIRTIYHKRNATGVEIVQETGLNKANCSFNGWKLGNRTIGKDEAITSNMTAVDDLVAQWNCNSGPAPIFTIKFYDYYGHILYSEQTCEANANDNTICMPPAFTIPEDECYNWCMNAKGCTDKVTNPYLGSLPVDGNKTFYCNDPTPYAVKMNLNGGKSSITNLTLISVPYYEKLTFDDMHDQFLGEVTREGYSLDGWCYESDCSGTILRQFVDYKENGKTLYANWITKADPPTTEPDPPTTEPEPSETGAPYEIINKDGCYKNKKILVKTCQAEDVEGALCKTEIGSILRKDIRFKGACGEIDDGPTTGTAIIAVSWILGVMALIASIYYFKKNKLASE